MNIEGLRHQYLRRIVAPVLRGIGLRVSTLVARRLARGVFEMNTPGRRRAEERLREAMKCASGTEDAEEMRCNHVTEVVSSMYEHMARFWTEALFIPKRLSHEDWRRFVAIENEEGLRALADSGRGCVLATGYYGNVAAAACALGHLFRPIHVIVDWFAQPGLVSWQRELYAQRWVRAVDRRDALRTMPEVLANGGAVLVVCEHERRQGYGVTTRFLGKTLNCYPTLGRLARWYDVPIGVLTCRRELKLFSFTMELHKVIEHDGTSADDDGVVRRCMRALECAIMQAPEQYMWSVGSGESQQAAVAKRPRSISPSDADVSSVGQVSY